MRGADVFTFGLGSLRGYPARSVLMLLAMGIGVAAVVILTALGEGARRYVTGEFASLGTNLVIVFPGRSETTGSGLGMMAGETPRDLTIRDAMALTRHRQVRRVAPIAVGSVPVSFGGREREVPILGSTAEMLPIRHWQMARGRFLPPGDPEQATPVAVLGNGLKQELFGTERALGQWVRMGDRRYRVIGILSSEGQSLGVNTDDVAIVPVASAMQLFNQTSVFRILVEARSRESLDQTREAIIDIIRERHQGEEDVTAVTQDAVLATFDRILGALTMTVGGIAGISLAVAGILIMNVMLVSVTQRTNEIGLLKALGAPGRQIQLLFLAEAAMLASFGAVAGLIVGQLGAAAIRWAYPALPAFPPYWAVGAALGVALLTGAVFGALPARRAARLDPVQALARRG